MKVSLERNFGDQIGYALQLKYQSSDLKYLRDSLIKHLLVETVEVCANCTRCFLKRHFYGTLWKE